MHPVEPQVSSENYWSHSFSITFYRSWFIAWIHNWFSHQCSQLVERYENFKKNPTKFPLRLHTIAHHLYAWFSIGQVNLIENLVIQLKLILIIEAIHRRSMVFYHHIVDVIKIQRVAKRVNIFCSAKTCNFFTYMCFVGYIEAFRLIHATES